MVDRGLRVFRCDECGYTTLSFKHCMSAAPCNQRLYGAYERKSPTCKGRQRIADEAVQAAYILGGKTAVTTLLNGLGQRCWWRCSPCRL